MLFGPPSIIKCPNCSARFYKMVLLSGNILGEKFYSDGKSIAPMVPDIPDLTKCYQCDNFFWIDSAEKIVTNDELNSAGNHNAQDRIEEVRFLTIDEYFEALKCPLVKNKNLERFVRLKIWWAFNDTLRDIKSVPTSKLNDERWRSNLEFFICLLDPFDINELIMIAEMHRNLGNFSKCLEIINYIDEDHVTWLKERFVEECNKKNSIVFEVGQSIII